MDASKYHRVDKELRQSVRDSIKDKNNRGPEEKAREQWILTGASKVHTVKRKKQKESRIQGKIST